MSRLRVEINEPPVWSFLWFYEDDTRMNGIALITTDDPKKIAQLKEVAVYLETFEQVSSDVLNVGSPVDRS